MKFMKRIQIVAILLVLFVGVFSSCNDKEFVIKGKLAGIEFETVYLVPMEDYKILGSSIIEDNGEFEIVTKGLKEGEYVLKFTDNEKIPVYISKSGVLILKIDYSNYMFNTSYEGDTAEESKFIYNVKNKQAVILSDFSVIIHTLDVKEVKRAFKKLNVDLINSVEAFKVFNVELKRIYTELIPYTVALSKLKYETSLRELSEGNTYIIPQDFNDYKKGINISNNSLVEYVDYVEFIRLFFRFDITQELLTKQGKYTVAEYVSLYVDQFKYETVPQRTKDIVLFTGVRFFMDDLVILKADTLIKVVIRNLSSREFKVNLRYFYEDIKKKEYILTGGVVAPNWVAKDTNGKQVSLSSFKGHYVFVEVWATWCAPCVKEIPHFMKLASKCRSKNISFVSISIDTNIEEWKSFVEKREGEVIHLIDTNGFKSQFMKDYYFDGVPQFMLFDPQGKVVDVKMPRPSDITVQKKLYNILN